MHLFDDLPEPSSTCTKDANLTPEVQTSKPCTADIQPRLLCISSSVVARKGERPEMQDSHVCIDDFSTYLRTSQPNEIRRLSYFSVFDGHGGCKASAFAAKRLHPYLASKLPKGLSQIDKDIKRVFYDVFKKVDEDFLKEACQQRPHWRDGTTASVVLLVDNTIYAANIGDSKVVLARSITEPLEEQAGCPSAPIATVCLTRDHSPIDYEERRRIQATGATVQNGRVNNILEVSRSFGDYQFKKQGVTCIPDMRKYQLTDLDRFMLIACDGLWKSFPPEEAVSLADRLLVKEFSRLSPDQWQNHDKTANVSCSLPVQRCLESVCTHLVNEAVLRMSGDNVTCVLVVFLDAFAPDAITSVHSGTPEQSACRDAESNGENPRDMDPPSKRSKNS